jgi:hypothetical protein
MENYVTACPIANSAAPTPSRNERVEVGSPLNSKIQTSNVPPKKNGFI